MLLQRVNRASVKINEREHAAIAKGLLVLVGIEEADEREDVEQLCNKLVQLRIFADADDKTNLSLQDTGGELLLVSQFTLHASTKKGNRPSFIRSARPEKAEPLFKELLARAEALLPGRVKAGVFGAYMQVALENDGPFTLLLDSRSKE